MELGLGLGLLGLELELGRVGAVGLRRVVGSVRLGLLLLVMTVEFDIFYNCSFFLLFLLQTRSRPARGDEGAGVLDERETRMRRQERERGKREGRIACPP